MDKRTTGNRMLWVGMRAASGHVHSTGRGSTRGGASPVLSPLPVGSCGWRSSLGMRNSPRPSYGVVPKFSHHLPSSAFWSHLCTTSILIYVVLKTQVIESSGSKSKTRIKGDWGSLSPASTPVTQSPIPSTNQKRQVCVLLGFVYPSRLYGHIINMKTYFYFPSFLCKK